MVFDRGGFVVVREIKLDFKFRFQKLGKVFRLAVHDASRGLFVEAEFDLINLR
jgi:hypothetical protein